MNNVFFILLHTQYNRDEIIISLAADAKIDNWFYSKPNTLYVKTNLNTREMSQYIQERFGSYLIFVTKADHDYFDKLTAQQWANFKEAK
jgi:hypothetical protein